MSRVLIVYATSHGHTRDVAQKLGDRLRTHDLDVRLADVSRRDAPSADDFDIIVLGSRVHGGSFDRRMRTYATRQRAALVYRPSYLFSVGMDASSPTGEQRELAAMALWSKSLKWTPLQTAAFAGALLYRSHNPIVRFWMKLRSLRHGDPTDTSRDHVLTDWAAVDRFADEIARNAQAAPRLDGAYSTQRLHV